MLISSQVFAQNLYFGIPQDNQDISSGDLLILNDIHWENGFSNFSNIGKQQIKKLATFLSKIEEKEIEIKVYSFYGGTELNQAISERISEKIFDLLIEENENLKTMLKVEPCGSTKTLFCENDDTFLYRMNTRIEIEIK